MFRVGFGYDAHGFATDRPLIIGGVTIPHDRGLAGHSDADVLTHAIMDALLGAVARGDIGQHFPDHDPAYGGADSLKLLVRVMEWVREDGYRINNIDGALVAQRPKMMPFKEMMRINLSKTMGVSINRINIKATTTEKMGFTGREEGIEAYAIASLIRGPNGLD